LSEGCGTVLADGKERRERTRVVLMLEEFWCSDCTSRSLFESLVAETEQVAGSEWACTACGAAYFDAIDLVVDAVVDTAVDTGSASGLAAERGVLVVG
jgi:hypothetical protein